MQGGLDLAEKLLNESLAAGAPPNIMRPYALEIREIRERNALIDLRLDQARSFINKGYLTQPPAKNAVAELREVEKIDPNNSEARLLLDECSILLVTVARDAWAHGFK